MSRREAATAPETRKFVRQVHEVLQQVAVLIRNTYFHDLSNTVFHEPLERLLSSLRPLLASEGGLQLERVQQELWGNGVRIRIELRSVHAYKLVLEELERRSIGGLRFEPGVDAEDVRTFLAAFASVGRDESDGLLRVNERLTVAGVTRILALPSREGTGDSGAETPNLRERALRTYQEALDFLRTSMTELDSPAELNQRRAKRVIHKLVDLSYEEAEGFSLFGLASIKNHDAYTFNHMVNVCVLAIAFGQRLGLTRQELAELGLCALYHDLGKLEIPAEVLNKPGKLSSEEWALMGNHTVFGARSMFPLLAQDLRVARRMLAVLQHHYGYDGQGYPAVRLLTRQTLYARIIAVVDLYDAMTTKRVYQEEFLPDAALRRMHELAGRYCDPVLTKAFTNCMGIFPAGSLVLLTSGELAVVLEPNRDPESLDRPRVRIVANVHHGLLEPAIADLTSEEYAGVSIRGCVDPDAWRINAAHFVV